MTACTVHRARLFGNVVDGAMFPDDLGNEVAVAWRALPIRYPGLALDGFVVMPNHVHGTLILGEGCESARDIMRALRSVSSRRVNIRRNPLGAPLWQRGFYDHIVRDDRDLARIREYIEANPARWSLDEENPERKALASGRAG